MEFQVNTNNVILAQINQVESGEYNVTECRFIFSSEYEGLTKIAVFTGANGDAYKITILNNKCEIPSELLTESQIVQIGVYAYEVQGTEFILRYSPMPTRFMIEKGSYVVNAVNMSRPTPTEVEQLQSQITHNANNIEGIQGDIAGINQELVGINGELLGINRDIDDIKSEQTEQNTKIQKNTDDIVEINQNISEIDGHINVINEDIDNLEQDLTNYSLITETGSQINLNVNSTNYQITAILKDKNGNVIYTSNAIDLPIESMIVNASYDNTTKEIVLTLQNGNTLRISVADLVSGLVSETQLQTILANYYTKTEVDNLLSNLAGRVSTNEEDIADIKEEQTTQNTNLEELQNQVETLQENLDNANSEIEELNTDISNMAKAMYKVDGQGTDITLQNTSENKLVEFGLEGRTEQEQLEGYNLLEVTKVYEQTILNGVTIETNQDGTITLNGTATANIDVNFMETNPLTEIELEANQNYILSKKVISGSASRIMIAYRFDGGSSTTFTTDIQNLNSSENVRKLQAVRIFVNNGDVFNNVTVGLMLLKGSTDKNWEPYCGGIPSPNPDFPQPIKNVTGNANVKIQNKNLFDGKLELGIYSGSTGAKSPSNSYIRSVNYIEVDELSDYKFSLSNGNGISLYIYEYKKDFSYNQSASKLVNSSSHLVTNKDTKYITFRTYSENTDINEKIQLEKGKSITSYVEGKEQNYPFTLGDIELCKIDTAQDYFYKENNKWYLHKEIRKRTILSVSEVGTASSGIKYANIGSVPNVLSNSYVYCDNYINSSDSTKNNSIRVAGVYLFVYDNRFTDVETAQSLLNGLEYYHIMKTPTDTEITDTTLINQLEATLQARSYDDITYITSTSDELGFDMNVVAVADANKVIENQNNEIDTIKSRLDLLEG